MSDQDVYEYSKGRNTNRDLRHFDACSIHVSDSSGHELSPSKVLEVYRSASKRTRPTSRSVRSGLGFDTNLRFSTSVRGRTKGNPPIFLDRPLFCSPISVKLRCLIAALGKTLWSPNVASYSYTFVTPLTKPLSIYSSPSECRLLYETTIIS